MTSLGLGVWGFPQIKDPLFRVPQKVSYVIYDPFCMPDVHYGFRVNRISLIGCSGAVSRQNMRLS